KKKNIILWVFFFFLYGLPDMQRIKDLHVGETIEEDDAVNQFVRVLHLFDGLFAPFLGKGLVAPVLKQTIMQPILVDGGELVTQRLVEEFDYGCISAHRDVSLLNCRSARGGDGQIISIPT